jgi:hypothetical protein
LILASRAAEGPATAAILRVMHHRRSDPPLLFGGARSNPRRAREYTRLVAIETHVSKISDFTRRRTGKLGILTRT